MNNKEPEPLDSATSLVVQPPFIVQCADGRRFFVVPLPPAKPRPYGQEKARTNIRLLPQTKRKLTLAKEQLHMSETACIEDALRDWFRKKRIE
jgi:hypothetical protein